MNDKKENEIFDLKLTVIFTIDSACDYGTFKKMKMTEVEFARMMIDEEGLHGIVADDFEIQDAWIDG